MKKATWLQLSPNQQLAKSHLDVIFFNLSARYSNIAERFLVVLMEERIREATMQIQMREINSLGDHELMDPCRFPDSPAIYHKILRTILEVRKLVLRHFSLPRPEFMRKQLIPTNADGKTGRFNAIKYSSYPWYVKPSLIRRWGSWAWMTRLLGRKLPSDDGNRYAPEGYIFTEIGPQAFKGKGIEEMDETCSRLANQGRGGCPFAG